MPKVITLAGSGGKGGFMDGEGKEVKFSTPTGIAVWMDGSILVADSGNHRIREIRPNGEVRTFAGNGRKGDVDGEVFLVAEFNYPTSIAVNVDGSILVADFGNHKIKQILSNELVRGVLTSAVPLPKVLVDLILIFFGLEVRTFAGTGKRGFFDGDCKNAKFNNPHGITVDSEGNVFVADSMNHRIRKISPQGLVTSPVKSCGCIPYDIVLAGFSGGNYWGAVNANGFAGVWNGANGTILVADYFNHRIRQILPTGEIRTIAGSGQKGYLDGEALKAEFHSPTALAINSDGAILVADSLNDRIRLINPNGTVVTLAGCGIGYADGDTSTAKFITPCGIAINSDGSTIIVENNRIRKIVMR